MIEKKHVLITGGAGYIGSLLAGDLLRSGWLVTVADSLLYGGDSLMGFMAHPGFHFVRADVCEPLAVRNAVRRDWPRPDAVIHLAGIVGFPACQAVGRQVAWRYNVDAVQRVYEQAAGMDVSRFLFTSTYSVYGMAGSNTAVDEACPTNPQSLYAESKLAAEQILQAQTADNCTPIIFRLATLYGISPRTRFDLIVNQFVLDAFSRRELIIYQRGYSRSFVHVRDISRGLQLGLEAPLARVRGRIFNLGNSSGNHTKDEIVSLVIKRLPETVIQYKDITFGGDMRDISVSFARVEKDLGFKATLSVDDGIREVVHALQTGLIRDPADMRYRNAHFIVQ